MIPIAKTPSSMKEGYHRMSLIIPPDLHRAFKAAAASEGRLMTELILDFIWDYVAKHAQAIPVRKSKQPKRGRQ